MNTAVILAGGVGSRMNMGDMPKQYLMYEDRPIIDFCLRTFNANEKIDKIIIVADPNWYGFINKWLEHSKINKFAGYALPGKTRQYSILNGLKEVAENASEEDIVIIHDAARPLVSDDLINKCLDTALVSDGAMPVLPAKDTFYFSEDGEHIKDLINRSKLFAGQAPESFKLRKYYDAYGAFTEEQLDKIVGSSELAFKAGMNVTMIDGEERNFKITTQDDLELLKSYLEA